MMTVSTEMIQESVRMFTVLAIELTVLFLVISYIVGILQMHIPPKKIQSILSGKQGKGYVIAGFLGAITPFCSCSTIPFLKGLLRANAGFGTMMVFLFASPLLNPIIIGLFVVTFGLNVAVFYFSVAMGVSILAGYSLEKLGFEKYIRAEAYIAPVSSKISQDSSAETIIENKWLEIWRTTWKDFLKVLPYLLGGLSIGAVIYGFMPADYVASVANENNPLAVPIAAIIGIPLYIRAEAVIPLSAVLATKGMGLGAIMALIIGSAGSSLTEVVLLKSFFKNQMIIAFLLVVIGMAVTAGYAYSYLF
ncbi:permease [Alkalimarinus coralli]|uniref:permease n=1 Tax=Alkalimarinus coralli TaxID=2935863 RepID=UPI00202B3793|nr:permease [Alkalimarinus coralli]